MARVGASIITYEVITGKALQRYLIIRRKSGKNNNRKISIAPVHAISSIVAVTSSRTG